MEDEEKIKELIKRRRLQILVSSYIYEELNENIISDSTWDKWAKELAELQNKYPELSEQVSTHREQFIGWTGDTASCLTYNTHIKATARMLLDIHRRKQNDKSANDF